MILEIITPEKQVFTGEVTSVKFPGTIEIFYKPQTGFPSLIAIT